MKIEILNSDEHTVTARIDGIKVIFKKIGFTEQIEQSKIFDMAGWVGLDLVYHATASFNILSDDFEELTEIEKL